MDPPAVGATEDALRRARVADPALEVLGLDVLDALPGRQRGGEHALEQRRRHPLAPTGLLAHPQRPADRERGEVAGGHADPRHAGEERTGARRGDPAVVGHDEVGEGRRDTGEAGQRAAGHPAALPLVPGARGDERVEPRSSGVPALVAVRRDRAVHEARVERSQREVVDPELGGGAGGIALEHDVGTRREREEPVVVGRVAEVEHRAPLPPVPHLRAGERTRRVAARRLDLGDARAVVGEQHAGHRTGDAGREVEDLDALQDSAHACTAVR